MAIRKAPTDFVVVETLEPQYAAGLSAAVSDKHGHAVLRLEKTSLTTPEAITRLGKHLGIKSALIDYAGLKDKHARTAQHVSIPGIDLRRRANFPKSSTGPGWTATLMGWAAQPLLAASIRGNRFRIVVRDLAKESSSEMERRASLLASANDPASGKPTSLWVINYFGAQRFGSARHGQGFVAEALIRGEFERALKLAIGTPARKDSGNTKTMSRMLASHWGKWETLAKALPKCPERKPIEILAQHSRRKSGVLAPEDFREAFAALPFFQQTMCVEAFQSKIWNATARKMVERMIAATGGATAKAARGLLSEDQYGQMAFAPAGAITPEWLGFKLPLLAPTTKLEEPWGTGAREVLEAEKTKLEELRVPGLKKPFFGEAQRPLVAEASRFAMSDAAQDDMEKGKRLKRVVEFDLPRGAYATVVLRGLGQ